MPATFTTDPLGASDPVRMASPPSAWIGRRQRVDHLAVGRRRVEGGQVLGHRLPGHGEAVAVEESGLEQLAHARPAPRRRRSTSTMWNRPWGLVSARCGTAPATRLKSSSSSVDPGLVGDGQQVEHGVGGATQGHDHGDGVLEGRLGHDLAGPDARPPAGRSPARPTRRRSRRGGGRRPAGDALPGSDMPMASATDAMVLAVNMPAHDPSVGQALCSMRRQLLVAQRARRRGRPTASKTLTMSRAWSPSRPGRMEPP